MTPSTPSSSPTGPTRPDAACVGNGRWCSGPLRRAGSPGARLRPRISTRIARPSKTLRAYARPSPDPLEPRGDRGSASPVRSTLRTPVATAAGSPVRGGCAEGGCRAPRGFPPTHLATWGHPSRAWGRQGLPNGGDTDRTRINHGSRLVHQGAGRQPFRRGRTTVDPGASHQFVVAIKSSVFTPGAAYRMGCVSDHCGRDSSRHSVRFTRRFDY
jgi:hypothetical protein